MKVTLASIRRLFPGKSIYLLVLNIFALFLVSVLDLVGVAAIFPIIQIASGEDYTTGYLGVLHDFLGEPDRNSMVLLTSLILVLAFVLKGIFSLIIKWWSGGFLAKQQTASSVTILQMYAHDSYLNHRKRTTADIMRSTVEANNQVYTAYIAGLLSVIGEAATIIMLMIMLLVIMPVQAVIAFAYFGLAAFLLQYFLKNKNQKVGEKALAMNWVASDSLLNAVQGFRENKISGMTDRKIYEFQEARLEAVQANRLKTFYQDLPKYILEIIFIIGIALMLAMMVLTNGIESAAYLIVFAGACVRILPSFVRMVGSLGFARTGVPSLALLDKELQRMGDQEIGFIPEDPDLGGFVKVNSSISKIDIDVDSLVFRYPDGEKNVLNSISVSVPAGSSLAIVGGSGSGKTTFIDILLGLIEPVSGRATFNNKDIHTNLAEWHGLVGYVPQDVFLSGKTIREEIAYGFKTEEIDEHRILECIHLAELGDVIDSLEKGLETVIGERGSRLSGGQRQRLGIARALYRNPSVLVLDEATSALDNKTEHKITKAINKLAKQLTVIIVAHRLSTVREVDQLAFMSQGEIVAHGTFEEVRRNNEDFAQLVKLGQLPE